MKILKYTFNIPQLVVEDGELVEMGATEETYTFTLLFKGIDLFEKIYNKPLLTELAKLSNVNEGNVANSLDVEMLKALAKASYCKIDGNAFHQNMITAEEFSKTSAFTRISMDTDFMIALLNMAVECCVNNQKVTGHTSTKK